MKYRFEEHCRDEALELYAAGRLEESSTEILEEHILICEACRIRLDEADRYAKAMRAGAARIRLQEKPKSGFFGRIFLWLPGPAPVWTTAAAAVCGLAIVASLALLRPGDTGPAVSVALRAERGTAATAPAHRRLDLQLDVRGLQLGAAPREEIVNADGRVLQKAAANEKADSVEFRTDRGWDAGTYFVRVFPAGATEAVREYALQLK